MHAYQSLGFHLGADAPMESALVVGRVASNVHIQAIDGRGTSAEGTTGLAPDAGRGAIQSYGSGGMPTWMIIVGGLAVAGGAYYLIKRRKKGGAVAGFAEALGLFPRRRRRRMRR